MARREQTERLDRTMGPHPMSDADWECLRARYQRRGADGTLYTMDVVHLSKVPCSRSSRAQIILALNPVALATGGIGPADVCSTWDGVERRRRVRRDVCETVLRAIEPLDVADYQIDADAGCLLDGTDGTK